MSPLPIDIAAALARRAVFVGAVREPAQRQAQQRRAVREPPLRDANRGAGGCEDAPHGQVFLTADAKLRKATLLTGFDAI